MKNKAILIISIVLIFVMSLTIFAGDPFRRVCSTSGCNNMIDYSSTGETGYHTTASTHTRYTVYRGYCSSCGTSSQAEIENSSPEAHSFSTSSSPAPGGGYYITHTCDTCGYSYTERDTSHINSHLGELGE